MFLFGCAIGAYFAFYFHFKEHKDNAGQVLVSDTTYNKVKTVFILDVNPLTQRNFDRMVRAVHKECKSGLIDAIMFVGYLPFSSRILFKVPDNLSPKKFHFVGTIFDRTVIDNRIFELKNWEVSLANYDLI